MIERSFQGLSGAVETMGIVEELMEIWLNEVCDSFTRMFYYHMSQACDEVYVTFPCYL